MSLKKKIAHEDNSVTKQSDFLQRPGQLELWQSSLLSKYSVNLGSFQSFCSSLNSRPGSKLKFSLCAFPRGARKTAVSSPSLLKGASRKTEASRARLQSQHHRGQSETWPGMYDDFTGQVRVMGSWGHGASPTYKHLPKKCSFLSLHRVGPSLYSSFLIWHFSIWH